MRTEGHITRDICFYAFYFSAHASVLLTQTTCCVGATISSLSLTVDWSRVYNGNTLHCLRLPTQAYHHNTHRWKHNSVTKSARRNGWTEAV